MLDDGTLSRINNQKREHTAHPFKAPAAGMEDFIVLLSRFDDFDDAQLTTALDAIDLVAETHRDCVSCYAKAMAFCEWFTRRRQPDRREGYSRAYESVTQRTERDYRAEVSDAIDAQWPVGVALPYPGPVVGRFDVAPRTPLPSTPVSKPSAVDHSRSTPDGSIGKQSGATPPIYLWLNCEGWERFGPFEWLRLDHEAGVIVDSTGAVIAKRRTHGGWFVNRAGMREMRFNDPMITASAVHPHPLRRETRG